MLSFPDSTYINWTILEREELMPFPFGITAKDSCIYILGTLDGKWVHKYSTTDGQYISGHINEGQAPCDLLNAANLQITKNKIHIYDLATKSIKSFDTHFSLSSSFTCQKHSPILEMWEMSDSTVLIKSAVISDTLPPTRSFKIIQTCGNENIISSYDVMPEYAITTPEILMVQSEAVLSPDLKHFASATTIGGTLELFEISHNKLIISKSEYLFPVQFEEPDMNIGDETKYGFTALAANNEYLFGAFSGTNNPNEATKIGVWNWKGQPICLLITDALILKMTLDSNNKNMYGIILDKNQELRLAKFTNPFK